MTWVQDSRWTFNVWELKRFSLTRSVQRNFFWVWDVPDSKNRCRILSCMPSSLFHVRTYNLPRIRGTVWLMIERKIVENCDWNLPGEIIESRRRTYILSCSILHLLQSQSPDCLVKVLCLSRPDGWQKFYLLFSLFENSSVFFSQIFISN